MQIYYKKCNYKMCKHKKCKKYLKSDKMREIDLSIFFVCLLGAFYYLCDTVTMIIYSYGFSK